MKHSDFLTFDEERRTTDNRRLAQWWMKWIIKYSNSHQLLWCIDSDVLRNLLLRQAPICCLIFLVLLSALTLHAQRDVAAYIQRYDSVAVAIMVEHQFPASLMLGLAIHESGAGTSRLSREQCNHFGMKGKRPSTHPKTGMVRGHLEFETDEASFLHFAKLITTKKFYENLRGNPDPLPWLKALKKTGYAASSKWVARVNNIIRKYNLTAYDHPMADTIKKILPASDTLNIQIGR